MFLASRGKQCPIRLSVWMMVPKIFEEGMGEMKTRVGDKATSLITAFRVEIQ